MAMFHLLFCPVGRAILLSILNFIDAHVLVIDDIKLIFVLVVPTHDEPGTLNYFVTNNGTLSHPPRKAAALLRFPWSSPMRQARCRWTPARPRPGSWFATSMSAVLPPLVSVMTAATQHMSCLLPCHFLIHITRVLFICCTASHLITSTR